MLTDISWKFDVIALSKTWNDEKNKSTFSPLNIQGYHTYTVITGSSQHGGCGFYINNSLSPLNGDRPIVAD